MNNSLFYDYDGNYAFQTQILLTISICEAKLHSNRHIYYQFHRINVHFIWTIKRSFSVMEKMNSNKLTTTNHNDTLKSTKQTMIMIQWKILKIQDTIKTTQSIWLNVLNPVRMIFLLGEGSRFGLELMRGRHARGRPQSHANAFELFQVIVAFTKVAVQTRSHCVRPHQLPALAARHHVIERQSLRRKLLTAILQAKRETHTNTFT